MTLARGSPGLFLLCYSMGMSGLAVETQEGTRRARLVHASTVEHRNLKEAADVYVLSAEGFYQVRITPSDRAGGYAHQLRIVLVHDTFEVRSHEGTLISWKFNGTLWEPNPNVPGKYVIKETPCRHIYHIPLINEAVLILGTSVEPDEDGDTVFVEAIFGGEDSLLSVSVVGEYEHE